ncbi:MAG TPA: serine hydrolase [Chitinophagaceae bacterium]|nr:serine hydrolase [Chitinophagaceae bacterium]
MNYRWVICSILFSLSCYLLTAQQSSDAWLKEYIYQHASPLLAEVLNKPDTFQYQFIYTKIERDGKNRPQLTHYYLNVDRDRYFNPASTVKLPLAILALEKLNEIKKAGINKETPMLTDSSFEKQTSVLRDTTASNGMPSIAQYIRKIFLVSDNDAYNRLYEFLGQEYINQKLWTRGYKDIRITRRFVSMNEEQNRHTNAVRFVKDNKVLWEQPPGVSQLTFNFSKKILIGKAHLNRSDSLINAPMDFTTHNNLPLEDLQQLLQSVIFPESVSSSKRFNLTRDDYKFLYQYLSEYPSESKWPHYDTSEYFNSYCKFFFFRAGKINPPPNIRSFSKPGWSYGFLTESAYIVDFKNKVEFMLSGVIYVNSDGVLNDDKYEYEKIGWPFFREVGNIMYQYELERNRKFVPKLDRFVVEYK